MNQGKVSPGSREADTGASKNRMKINLPYYILTTLTVLLFSCESTNKNETKVENDSTEILNDSLPYDTGTLRETFNEEDIAVNGYLTERLKPVRENFKRINSIAKWTSIVSKDIWETNEGGDAKFYYQDGKLEKIVTSHFGETFQQLTEFYLLNGKLSFVFEKSYKYNRPIYYDTKAMKENNDTVAFDIKKSEIEEVRSYFENANLLHQISNQHRDSPPADDYLHEEQKRIKSNFGKIVELANEGA
jgi:hypothetical protein